MTYVFVSLNVREPVVIFTETTKVPYPIFNPPEVEVVTKPLASSIVIPEKPLTSELMIVPFRFHPVPPE